MSLLVAQMTNSMFYLGKKINFRWKLGSPDIIAYYRGKINIQSETL